MNRLCFATLLALALGGCRGTKSSVYALHADEAYRRLLASELTDLVRARQCGRPIAVRSEGETGRSVTWRAYSLGREVARFTATLAPAGENRTKVEIAISPEDGSDSHGEPAFNQPLRPAVEEQVAALLEGRAFDRSRLPRGSSPGCDVGRFALQSGRRYPVDKRPGAEVRRYRRAGGPSADRSRP